MKKLLSLFIILTMLFSALAINTSAALNIGLVKVTHASTSSIIIDGAVNSGEWNQASRLTLKGGDNFKGWTLQDYSGTIDCYFSWADDGFYIAAKITDSTFSPSELEDDGWYGTDIAYMRDRFLLALNPCGLIYDNYSPLFFSFCPAFDPNTVTAETVTEGELFCRKHNWEESYVDDQITINGVEVGYKGRFTKTSEGWDMEAVLPWSVIASKDRKYDILAPNMLDPQYESRYLTMFDPYHSDRSKAFANACIIYVDTETNSDAVIATGRTAKRENLIDSFVSESLDITFKFYKPGENIFNTTVTPFTLDEIKAFDDDPFYEKEYDEEQEDKFPYETEKPLSTLPPDIYSPEDEFDQYVTDYPDYRPATDNAAQGFGTSNDEEYETTFGTDKETNEKVTKKPSSKKDNDDDDDDKTSSTSGNSSTLFIIIISIVSGIALIAIAAVIVLVVVIKKKK